MHEKLGANATSPEHHLEAGLPKTPGLNAGAGTIVDMLVADQARLGLSIKQQEFNGLLINANNADENAALMIVSLLLGGRGSVTSTTMQLPGGRHVKAVRVEVEEPVVPCMSSQFAGKAVIIDGKYFGPASGPFRALTHPDKTAREVGYREMPEADGRCAVFLERAKELTDQQFSSIVKDLEIAEKSPVIIQAGTNSLTGLINVAGRSVETLLHAMHFHGFSLAPDNAVKIVRGSGICPIAPTCADDFQALGVTNDVMRHFGSIELTVATAEAGEELAKVCRNVPSWCAKNRSILNHSVTLPADFNPEKLADKDLFHTSVSDLLQLANYQFEPISFVFSVANISLVGPRGEMVCAIRSEGADLEFSASIGRRLYGTGE